MTEPIVQFMCPCGVHYAVVALPPVSPLDVPGIPDTLPTAEQEDALRERLRVFTEIVLPAAGMGVSKSIGGAPQKVRAYAQLRYQVSNVNKMTVEQWKDLLDHFDKAPNHTDLVAEIEAACS